jgi:hypothetical protein
MNSADSKNNPMTGDAFTHGRAHGDSPHRILVVSNDGEIVRFHDTNQPTEPTNPIQMSIHDWRKKSAGMEELP